MRLEKSINKTIEYARKFESEINEDEICERLISATIYDKKEIKERLKKKNLVFCRNKYKSNKIRKAKELGQFLDKNFKDILFLGVSGSVATGHPKQDDDIDLIIITKSNKIWTTRLVLRWTIFWKNIPHRKYGQTAKADEFCFNLWLDEDGLKLPLKKHNLQSAMDLIMITPLFDKKNIYKKLLDSNSWAQKYVATGYNRKMSNFQFPKSNKKIEDSRLKRNIIDEIINKLFFWPQFWYMKNKVTTEIINYHQAIFFK